MHPRVTEGSERPFSRTFLLGVVPAAPEGCEETRRAKTCRRRFIIDTTPIRRMSLTPEDFSEFLRTGDEDEDADERPLGDLLADLAVDGDEDFDSVEAVREIRERT